MKKILVIDDDKQIIDLIIQILGSKFNLSVAMSYDEAIYFLDNKPFDLVITDINLSEEKTGFDIINYLETTVPLTKIIVISGYYVTELIKNHLLVPKPFSSEELLSQIDTILNVD